MSKTYTFFSYMFLSAMATAYGNEETTFRLNPYHVNQGVIEKVNENETVSITDLTNPRLHCRVSGVADSDLSEGHYLAFVGPDTNFAFDALELPTHPTWVSPVEVLRIEGKNQATIQLPPDAVQRLTVGHKIAIFRPPGSTTEKIIATPVATIENPPEQVRATAKLLAIGQALSDWHDTFDGFPPVVVRGPDGTPWHSWRVLILPYLGRADLYNRYHFDEPWNGPNNKMLLEETPEAYQYLSGEVFPRTATQFVSIVGKKTAFVPEGLTNHDPAHWSIGDYKPGVHGSKVEDFTDGVSNTLLVGTADPASPIEWMKPDDVSILQLKPPGNPGSFGAPFTAGSTAFGSFLWADGSVSTISRTIRRSDFHSLFTIGGDEFPYGRPNHQSAISPSMGSAGITASSTLRFVVEDNHTVAEILFAESEKPTE